ncbi:MAG: TolC family protein [Pyramidobacter sp.]|jgi:outer membrane protein
MRKKIIIALALTAVLTALAGSGAAQKQKELPLLTVEKALQLAYKNNPSLSAAEFRVEQARQQIRQARADKLPHLYAELAGAWQGEEGHIPVYQLTPSQSLSSVPFALAANSFKDAYRAALGVQWLVFSGGAVENVIAARELTWRGIKAQEVRTGQAVENSVRVCYYDLQRARAQLTVAEEVRTLSKEHLSQVEYFFKYGVVAQDEVLRLQVEVSNSELNVISARNAVDVRWRALERAVGLTLHDRFVMPHPEMKVADHPVPHWDENSLYDWRPELRALDFMREAADAASRASRAANNPKVILSGEGFNMGRDFWPHDLDTWKVSAGLRWDFYDGGKSIAQSKEYRAQAKELLAKMEDLKKQIALEVSSAQLNYQSSRQRIDVAARQVVSAQEDYRMALMRYKVSVGTNLDVLDARTALTNARTQLVNAVYDTESSRANLDYALGLSDQYMLEPSAARKGAEPPKAAAKTEPPAPKRKTPEKGATKK